MSFEEECKESERKLQNFIYQDKLDAEIVIFNESVHSTETSKKALGVGPEKVLKSIVLKGDGLFVCILQGSEKVDFGKLRKILNTKNLRTANPEEVLALTGYIVGGVPPFGYEAIFYLDQKACDTLKDEYVYAGGGSPRALLKTKIEEIKKATKAEIIAFSSPKLP
jgi:prolyl-tRNA editing enzyme YbaK/EbsC (Cys-tRNA(Pro) deacylase)